MEKRTVEQLTREMKKNNETISELLRINSQLATEIELYKGEDKDYISLPNASRKYGISYATLYKKVQTGSLRNYSTTGVIMVRQSEVENVMFKQA